MKDSSKCDLNGTRIPMTHCPKCRSTFDLSYALPAPNKHFIQMHCHDCEISWKLDDRTLRLERGFGVTPSYVTYVISALKPWFVE